MKDVSVIFVNYKTPELTVNAINSVYEKTENLDFEIIVVDNNSNDGSVEFLKSKFPGVKIIENSENSGFGAANNLAIKISDAKYVFCLNTDTLIVNNAIKILFDFMEKNLRVGACGGFLTDENGSPVDCGGNFPNFTEILWKFGPRYVFKQAYKKYKLTINSADTVHTKRLGYITGADIMFRKSVLADVGLFDEKFFMYYEETDLCKRIKNAGFDIKFVPSAKIVHLEGQSCDVPLTKKKRSKKSEFYYFKKHSPACLPFVKLCYVILYLAEAVFTMSGDSLELAKYVATL